MASYATVRQRRKYLTDVLTMWLRYYGHRHFITSGTWKGMKLKFPMYCVELYEKAIFSRNASLFLAGQGQPGMVLLLRKLGGASFRWEAGSNLTVGPFLRSWFCRNYHVVILEHSHLLCVSVSWREVGSTLWHRQNHQLSVLSSSWPQPCCRAGILKGLSKEARVW